MTDDWTYCLRCGQGLRDGRTVHRTRDECIEYLKYMKDVWEKRCTISGLTRWESPERKFDPRMMMKGDSFQISYGSEDGTEPIIVRVAANQTVLLKQGRRVLASARRVV